MYKKLNIYFELCFRNNSMYNKVVDKQSVLKKIYYVIPSWYLKVFADFLVPWSFIAIAADTNSIDTVGFIQIVESSCVGDSVM